MIVDLGAKSKKKLRYETRKTVLTQAHDFFYKFNCGQLVDMNHTQLTRPKPQDRTFELKKQKQTSLYLVLINGRKREWKYSLSKRKTTRKMYRKG